GVAYRPSTLGRARGLYVGRVPRRREVMVSQVRETHGPEVSTPNQAAPDGHEWVRTFRNLHLRHDTVHGDGGSSRPPATPVPRHRHGQPELETRIPDWPGLLSFRDSGLLLH